MADTEDPNDWKVVFILGGFIAYLLASYFIFSFSFGGFIVFVSLLTLLLGYDFEGTNKVQTGMLLGFFVLVFFSWKVLYPDSSAIAYFLMIATAISAHTDPKNVVLYLGTATLMLVVFNASVIGFITMIVFILFIRSSLDEENGVTMGIITMIPLLAVGWFIGSGWGNIVEQKVDGFTTQVGATTGISTDVVGSKITSALNNTWLLFTNPEQWYVNVFIDTGNQESIFALEVRSINAIPQDVIAGGKFDVIYELENRGKEAAKNVKIWANGDELAEACGKINGRLCNTYCEGSGDPISCSFAKNLRDISKNDKRFEKIPFTAPKCPGTYEVGVKVAYDYTASAMLMFEMISKGYYDELLQNDKLNFKDTISDSTSGPFKVTIRINQQQPIPDKTEDNEFQNFTIYVGLINNYAGTGKIKEVSLYVPDTFEALNVENNDTCTIKEVKKGEPGYFEVKDHTQYRSKAKDIVVEQNGLTYMSCDFRQTKDVEQIKSFDLTAKANYTFTYTRQTTVNVRGEPGTSGVAKPDCKKTLKIRNDPTDPSLKTSQARDDVLESLAKKITACYLTNTEGIDSLLDTCANVNINLANCKDAITRQELINKVDGHTKEVGDNIMIYLDDVKSPDAALSGDNTYTGFIQFNGGYGASKWVDLKVSPRAKGDGECPQTAG